MSDQTTQNPANGDEQKPAAPQPEEAGDVAAPASTEGQADQGEGASEGSASA